MKFKLYLFFVINILSNLFMNSDLSGADLYPFSQKSTLSWDRFEQNFRRQYGHLNIPKIVINNLPGNRASGYNDGTQEIDFNPQRALNSECAEWILLHESGHHNMNKELREKNIQQGYDAVNRAVSMSSAGLSYLQKGLMVGNAYHILFRKPWVALLAAQGLTTAILNSPEKIRSFFNGTLYHLHATKPEEIMADAFANQHASKEVLQAAAYMKSKQGFYDGLSKESEISIKRAEFLIDQELQKEKPNQGLIDCWKREPFIQRIVTNFPFSYEIGCIVNSFAYPTLSQRKRSIEEAMQKRFGN